MPRRIPSTPWILAAVLGSAACAVAPAARYEFSRAAMGTSFRIVLYAPDRRLAERAAQAAFARIEELDGIMSDYDAGSELSRLSRASDGPVPTEWIPISPDLAFVLERSQELADETGGAFDVTVGPYVRLWRRARRQGEVPSRERLEEARASVGHAALELDPERRAARLDAPHMRLDLGGIAKGYALDQGMIVLHEHGIDRALVDGGGDVLAGSAPPGRSGWRVQIVGLGGSGAREIELAKAAAATSGDLERYVEVDGVRYSHLIDPATGWGLTRRSLVTVVARSGIDADGWASALSVLGPERGFPLLARIGAEARVVELSGGEARVSATPGFPRAVSCDSAVTSDSSEEVER